MKDSKNLLILAAVLYAAFMFTMVCRERLYKRHGLHRWPAAVPFYTNAVFGELVGRPGFGLAVMVLKLAVLLLFAETISLSAQIVLLHPEGVDMSLIEPKTIVLTGLCGLGVIVFSIASIILSSVMKSDYADKYGISKPITALWCICPPAGYAVLEYQEKKKAREGAEAKPCVKGVKS